MAVDSLDEKDQALLRRCLEFILHTPLLGVDFGTRLGVSRAEITSLLARWPSPGDDADESPATIAINNTLNEIVHGLHLSSADLDFLASSRGAVQALYFRWASLRGWTATGMR